MKLSKKVLSIMLAMAISVTAVPLPYIQAYAVETSQKSGTCGKNLTWTLSNDGTLTISGTGEMFNWNNKTFWDRENIKSVVIENGVTSIGDGAFSDCSNLVSISIPEGLTTIGGSAFRYCFKLKSISLPKSITDIGNNAFTGCRFTSISIPESVQSIGDYAFSNCTKLADVLIPEGVKSIGERAFEYTIIGSVNIPASVSEIGENAFFSEELKSINVAESNNTYCTLDGILYSKDLSTLIKAPVNIESITIPESVTEISNYAFYDCTMLNDISVPDNITSIGSNILYGTSYYYNSDNWEDGALYIGHYLINAKDVKGNYKIKDGTTVIAGEAFYLNKNITSVFLPDSVITIGNKAFRYSAIAGNLVIPDSVVIIGNDAFSDCRNLTGNLVIPDSVVTIGDSAFDTCSGFTGQLTIPDSVTKIGKKAFWSCRQFTEITIPNSVIIEKEAFGSCFSLETLNVTGGGYKTEWDLAFIDVSFKKVNFERTVLNYKITDNVYDAVHYAEKQEINLNIIENNTYSNVTNYETFFSTDKLVEAKNPEGELFALYGNGDSIVVVPKNSKEKQIKIENKGFTYGASAIGDDGYYYVIWGKSISDDVIGNSMNEENIQVCKYDNSGKLIKTLGLPVLYTEAQFPFDYGNANISYNKGFLCVLFSTRWTVLPSDGLHHQGSEFIGINTETMELVNFDKIVVSHEFGISMIPTDYGFAAIQRGDANPRGISIDRYYLKDGTIERLETGSENKILYHSSGQYGTNGHHLDGNCTYVYMGGLAKSNSTYAIAGKSEHIYTSDIYKESGLGNGIYDVFVRIADLSLVNSNNPDFTGTTRIDEATGEDADYNVIWLTQCNDKEKAANVKIVSLPDGSYCVLWEKLVNGKFDSIRYVVLDECGHTLRRETAIYGARLSCTSIQPIVQGNTLSWAVANKNNKTITWYSVDLAKQEKYDEDKVTEYKITDNNTEKENNNVSKNDEDIDYNVNTGKTFIIRGLTYKQISGNTKEVQLAGSTSKKGTKSIIIPSSIKVSGKSYKVISVAANALKARTKLKKLQIGSNIENIGKCAFKDCKNLKNIVIKSNKLTLEKTGSDAFKGINSKAVIKVPKGKAASYKKIIYAKGAGKNIKIK